MITSNPAAISRFSSLAALDATVEAMQRDGSWRGCYSMACAVDGCAVYLAAFGNESALDLAEAMLLHRASHSTPNA